MLAFASVPMLLAGLVLHRRPVRRGRLRARVGAGRHGVLRALRAALGRHRHAVVVGLVYLLVWEGLLGGLLDGVRWLSITRWSAEVADRVAGLTLVALPLTYALARRRGRDRRRHLAHRPAAAGVQPDRDE